MPVDTGTGNPTALLDLILRDLAMQFLCQIQGIHVGLSCICTIISQDSYHGVQKFPVMIFAEHFCGWPTFPLSARAGLLQALFINT